MFDFVLQLRETLTQRDLQKLGSACVDAAAREAAYCVAVALGRCRAAQQALPSDLDGTLDAPTAVAATAHARWLVGQLKSQFSQLMVPPVADDVVDEFADEDTCCSIVLTRHELWAATNAIYEADDALGAHGEGSTVLADELALLIEETGALDAMLISHADLLAPAAEFPLLGNLRRSVRVTGLTTLWWLEGTIESAAERRVQTFLNTLPNPKLIERRVQAATSNATQMPGPQEHAPIPVVARLLSGLIVSRSASAEVSGGDVSVQVTATSEGAGRTLTVSICCQTTGRQRVDWDGVPVRLESLRDRSRYYCTLNDEGRASIHSLPLGTYRIQSWPTAVRINDPSLQGGQPPELSRDRSIRVNVLEDLITVEVEMSEHLPANARLVGVLVNADGTEAMPEREIDLTHQGARRCGTMLLSEIERGSLTGAPALAAAANSQFEWLLVFVEGA